MKPTPAPAKKRDYCASVTYAARGTAAPATAGGHLVRWRQTLRQNHLRWISPPVPEEGAGEAAAPLATVLPLSNCLSGEAKAK